jgi:putative FmdB family regulatory protein
MPTYDYECEACGHTWEMFQRIVEDPIKQCPDCKKKKARRLFGTGGAVMFKGSGFYETDYRSESYKKGEKAAKDASSKSDSGGDKGSKSSGSKKSPPG